MYAILLQTSHDYWLWTLNNRNSKKKRTIVSQQRYKINIYKNPGVRNYITMTYDFGMHIESFTKVKNRDDILFLLIIWQSVLCAVVYKNSRKTFDYTYHVLQKYICVQVLQIAGVYYWSMISYKLWDVLSFHIVYTVQICPFFSCFIYICPQG